MTEEKAIEIMKEWIEYEKANKNKINKADELIEVQETIVKALEKKNKMIDEIIQRVYLTKQEQEKMKEYIYSSNKKKDFYSFVKQYFEKKAEKEQ